MSKNWCYTFYQFLSVYQLYIDNRKPKWSIYKSYKRSYSIISRWNIFPPNGRSLSDSSYLYFRVTRSKVIIKNSFCNNCTYFTKNIYAIFLSTHLRSLLANIVTILKCVVVSCWESYPFRRSCVIDIFRLSHPFSFQLIYLRFDLYIHFLIYFPGSLRHSVFLLPLLNKFSDTVYRIMLVFYFV